MRVEKRNVYTFEELSEETKDIIIENWRNSENDYFIGPEYDDYYFDDLSEHGFILEDFTQFRYSVNNCQGDGVSFLCMSFKEDLLFKQFLNENKKYTRILKIIKKHCDYDFSINIKNHHYVHEKTVEFEFYCSSLNLTFIDNEIDNFCIDFNEFVENIRIDLCLKYEKMLYNEIDYINSSEAITETILSNNYEFLIDGTMI